MLSLPPAPAGGRITDSSRGHLFLEMRRDSELVRGAHSRYRGVARRNSSESLLILCIQVL